MWQRQLADIPELAISPNGNLLAACDWQLYCLSPTGQVLWLHKRDALSWGPPAVDVDDNVYMCTGEGELFSLTATGKLRWSTMLDNPTCSAVAYDGLSSVYVLDGWNAVYSFSTEGALNWKRECYPPLMRSGSRYNNHAPIGGDKPGIAAGGTVLYADDKSDEHGLYALSPAGDVLWHTDELLYQYRYIAELELIVSPRMCAVSAQDGSLLWEADLGVLYGEHPPVLAADGNLWFTSSGIRHDPLEDGKGLRSGLHAISPEGLIVFSYEMPSMAYSRPVRTAPDLLAFVGEDGVLYLFNVVHRQMLRIEMSQPLARTEVAVSGTRLYVGDTTGRVYAIDTDSLEFTD